jgi:hypothetical protein
MTYGMEWAGLGLIALLVLVPPRDRSALLRCQFSRRN